MSLGPVCNPRGQDDRSTPLPDRADILPSPLQVVGPQGGSAMLLNWAVPDRASWSQSSRAPSLVWLLKGAVCLTFHPVNVPSKKQSELDSLGFR